MKCPEILLEKVNFFEKKFEFKKNILQTKKVSGNEFPGFCLALINAKITNPWCGWDKGKLLTRDLVSTGKAQNLPETGRRLSAG